VADELTGQDAKAIRFAVKNLMLLVEGEIGERQAMPVARIRRDSAGHYMQDEKFIPPSLSLQASPYLMGILHRLVEAMEEKARTMARPKDLASASMSGFSIEGISNAWFLHSVNSALGPLRHMMLAKNAHPEELYSELARLGGALCTFGLESHPARLPLYDHEHPTECFAALDHHIRTHLELVVPSNCVRIELSAGAPHFWSGAVADARTLVHSQWILGIRCAIGESEVISGVPRLVKVCSQEFVPKLVARALPGMTLRHLPVAPPAVNARVDFQYFGIDKAGPCWEHIMQSKRVGVYVPGELPGPDLELMVILES
jgi:type VI secretion system protein ImpJ